MFVCVCVLCKILLPGVLQKCRETDSKTQKAGGGLGPLRCICAIDEDTITVTPRLTSDPANEFFG